MRKCRFLGVSEKEDDGTRLLGDKRKEEHIAPE